MISPPGENFADALPDPLSITGRGMGINSSHAGEGSTTGATEAETVVGTSGAVAVIAASTATEVAANLTSSEPSVEGRIVLPSGSTLAARSSA